MPAIDFVSTVRSAYDNRRAMLMGGVVCIGGALACAARSHSPIFWAITAGFVLLTIYRHVDMTMFRRVHIEPTDIETAAHWELRATYGAAVWAALAGFWCFTSFAIVRDPSTEIISLVATIGCLVGIVARNFGLDRMLTIQLAIVAFFVTAGLLLRDDPYHWVLAAFMLPMLISYRFLATDVRAILLAAVHGRVEASRLADELDAALDTMQHALCMLEANGTISIVNDRAIATFAALVPGNWVGRPFQELATAAAAAGTMPVSAADELIRAVDLRRDGKVLMLLPEDRYYEVTVSSRQERTVLLFEDITDRTRAAERMTFMARYDALTGLPNRAYFTEQVEADLERWRHDTAPEAARDLIGLMIIDLDDFKHVNDTEGHLMGDKLLVEAAQRIRQALGTRSIIARLGGDEFIAYRSGGTDPGLLIDDAQAVLAAFRAPFDLPGEHIAVSVSIGAVTSDHRQDDLGVLMTKADLALYKSKAQGKAQSQLFHADMDVEYRYRQRLKHELRDAIANDALSLVYQPVIDIKTRHVVACEALARWHHPELGTIPPSVFIPIAEESGLISDISRWVLNTATAECRNWPEEVRIAVNISAKDLRSGDVSQMVGTALAKSGLPPHRLEIEVTETAVIEEREAANVIFRTLSAQGIGIALDDFGTGYSSLSYLQALPFTKLKIDRSFVIDIANNARAMKLLTNVARLGKDIGLTVTAEGVETEQQLAQITDHTEIDQIQGYLFGVPLPRRDVFELIARLSTKDQPIGSGRQNANMVKAR